MCKLKIIQNADTPPPIILYQDNHSLLDYDNLYKDRSSKCTDTGNSVQNSILLPLALSLPSYNVLS